MGQEASSPIDENVPPEILESRTLDAVAKYIKDGHISDIVVFVGAGISTSAGIPDFRTPGKGLYDTLRVKGLPRNEAIFDLAFFKENPDPFYSLAKTLYPGSRRPTITHSFLHLLHLKGCLLKVFSQNIDSLEQEAGLPREKMIYAHGNFLTQRCIECFTEYPDDEMREKVEKEEVPRCNSCNAFVKPDIVFFGEKLPMEFLDNMYLGHRAQLAIVMGTSLQVQPFASLPQELPEGMPRLLINMFQVGDLGTRADDVLLLGTCDDGVRQLASSLGWLEELEELWAKTARGGDVTTAQPPPIPKPTQPPKEPEPPAENIDSADARENALRREVTKLGEDIDRNLALSGSHLKKVNKELAKSGAGYSAAGATREDQELWKRLEDEIFGSDGTKPALQGTEKPGKLKLEKTGDDDGGGRENGLGHVFPHLKGMSSL
ncbi:NAD-dependent deacetylase sirtuin-2 [Aulographum hederae CBS 113979]|uniref:NAD-dependent deacetylase sirtuin-2 n=1 Tax=Aulographum hederae CBS 113979 TaxID=1176131 RepID=A0A6G1GY52_9PEZI|nr:NAD-dependent deacetylase sirtuin-2 [Aulographum hederae CBS 113979]